MYMFSIAASGMNGGKVYVHKMCKEINEIDFSQSDIFTLDKIMRFLGKNYIMRGETMVRTFPTTDLEFAETFAFIGVSQLFPDEIIEELSLEQRKMEDKMKRNILRSFKNVYQGRGSRGKSLLSFFVTDQIKDFFIDLAEKRKIDWFADCLKELFASGVIPEYWFTGKPQAGKMEKELCEKKMDELFSWGRIMEGGKTDISLLCLEKIGFVPPVVAMNKLDFIWNIH